MWKKFDLKLENYFKQQNYKKIKPHATNVQRTAIPILGAFVYCTKIQINASVIGYTSCHRAADE